MKKRIQHYILNEPWEGQVERLAERMRRFAVVPFLVFATLYIGGMVVAALWRH